MDLSSPYLRTVPAFVSVRCKLQEKLPRVTWPLGKALSATRALGRVKVIPLKLFSYQTFLKLGIVNIHDTNIQKMQ